MICITNHSINIAVDKFDENVNQNGRLRGLE